MGQGFSKSYEVRWADLDVNWHLRNTAYVEYGIDARLSYLNEGGFPPERFQELGFGPVVLREELRYLREVRLGQTVSLNFKIAGLSEEGSHWEVHHDVGREDGILAATLRIEGGWLDLSRRRLMRPPDELMRLLRVLPGTEDFRVLEPLVKAAKKPGGAKI